MKNKSENEVCILVAYTGCVYLEVAHVISLLSNSMRIAVATPDGGPIAVGEGFSLNADYSYESIPESMVKAVIVPGGDIYDIKDNTALDDLLRNSFRAGITIGGICNGALIVAKSGILDGRKMTHMATERHAPRPEFAELLAYAAPKIASTRYVDENLVIDSKIVTAKPWATIAFAKHVGLLCGVLTETEANQWESYQLGVNVKFNGLKPLIRKAILCDREAIHVAHMRSIREICIKDHGSEEIKGWGYRELGDRWIEGITKNLVWVVELNEVVQGLAAITFDPKDGHGHIQALYLTPDVVNMGVGRAFMEAMLDCAKEKGVDLISLDSTLTAYEFYKKFGFKDNGPRTKRPIGGSPVTSIPMQLSFA